MKYILLTFCGMWRDTNKLSKTTPTKNTPKIHIEFFAKTLFFFLAGLTFSVIYAKTILLNKSIKQIALGFIQIYDDCLSILKKKTKNKIKYQIV